MATDVQVSQVVIEVTQSRTTSEARISQVAMEVTRELQPVITATTNKLTPSVT